VPAPAGGGGAVVVSVELPGLCGFRAAPGCSPPAADGDGDELLQGPAGMKYTGPMPHRDRTINYVEFTVPDVAAAKRFYGEVFGWTFTDYGPDYASFAAADSGTD